MTLTLTLTIELDNDLWGSDEEEIDFLKKEVLAGELYLHSNEIGDTIGDIKQVDNIIIKP